MKNDDQKYQLTDEQKKAMRMLSEGISSVEVATVLMIDPETVWDWRHNNIAFMAAYNDAISDQHRAVSRKLADGREKAIERLVELVNHRDKNVALKAASILVRLDFPEPKGETDPQILENKMYMFGGFS